MAVIEEVPGLVVTIDVAGQDLPEYNDSDEEDPQPRTSYAYVQAESGADFSIARRYDTNVFHHVQETIRFQILLDGESVVYSTDSPAHIATRERWLTSEVPYDMGDRNVWQKFTFAELTIAEGDADKKLWGKLTDLGTITVKVWRVRFEAVPQPPPPSVPGSQNHRSGSLRGRRRRGRRIQAAPQPPPRRPDVLPKPLLDNDQVPEKNLKGSAVSHQAKLSVSREMPHLPGDRNRAPTPRMIYIDNTPIATFNFKYRSREALHALQIVPRTPSPVPLEDRPVEELTAEELRELVTRQREQEAMKADGVKIKTEVKRELPQNESDSEIDELEVTVGSSKKIKTGEVIELSDDE